MCAIDIIQDPYLLGCAEDLGVWVASHFWTMTSLAGFWEEKNFSIYNFVTDCIEYIANFFTNLHSQEALCWLSHLIHLSL